MQDQKRTKCNNCNKRSGTLSNFYQDNWIWGGMSLQEKATCCANVKMSPLNYGDTPYCFFNSSKMHEAGDKRHPLSEDLCTYRIALDSYNKEEADALPTFKLRDVLENDNVTL